MIVTVRQSGNILKVTPACETLLGPELQYSHRLLLHGRQAYGKRRAVQLVTRKVYEVQDDSLYALVGLRDRILRRLAQSGVGVDFSDLRGGFKYAPDYDGLFTKMPQLEFRAGQPEVLALMVGKDQGQIVAPTGWGKSFIVRCLACLYPEASILVVVPSIALLNGMVKELLKYTPDIGVVGAGKNKHRRVTVTTSQSLLRAPVEACDILLFDECHQAAASAVAEALTAVRHPYKRFGFTATPTGRSDGAEMVIEALFGPPVYWVPYDDAVKAGSVAPIKVRLVSLGRASVPLKYTSAGVVSRVAKKGRCYWRNTARNRRLADAIPEAAKQFGLGSDPQVLVLVETLEHAAYLRMCLPDYALVYGGTDISRIEELKLAGLLPQDYVPLTTETREQLRCAFQAGTLRKAIATGCWGTGVDFVNLDILVYASGEPGEIPVTQWGGRNSRVREGKEFGVILDCADQFDKWAAKRAAMRKRQYGRHGWEIIKDAAGGAYAEAAHGH